jgi:hypothetical protein
MKDIDFLNSIFEPGEEKKNKKEFDGQLYSDVSKTLNNLQKKKDGILFTLDGMGDITNKRLQLAAKKKAPLLLKELNIVSDSIKIMQSKKDSLSNEYNIFRKLNPK